MKPINEYLLSKNKKSNKTSRFEDVKDAVSARFEDLFKSPLIMLENNKGIKNFEFLMELMLDLVDNGFVFGVERQTNGEYTYVCTDGNVHKLKDGQSKIIRMFKFGDGVAVDLLNCKKLIDLSIIMSEVDFEIYYAETPNVDDFETAYRNGSFEYDCIFSVKQKELTDSDEEKIKRLFEKLK